MRKQVSRPSRRSRGSVTIEDVAREAGVSAMTIFASNDGMAAAMVGVAADLRARRGGTSVGPAERLLAHQLIIRQSAAAPSER